METRELTNGMIELVAAPGKWLRLKDSETYVPRVPVRPGDAALWEEVADRPPYSEDEYKTKVEELIRERYTVSDEFALINNVMTAPTEATQEEYARYQQYREECKRRAKETLAAPANDGKEVGDGEL